jgi:hypothetical protein
MRNSKMKSVTAATIVALAATSALAAGRMPYAQALAICKGGAAALVEGTPFAGGGGRGLLGIVGFAASQQRQADIVNGCLAEHGYVVQ